MLTRIQNMHIPASSILVCCACAIGCNHRVWATSQRYVQMYIAERLPNDNNQCLHTGHSTDHFPNSLSLSTIFAASKPIGTPERCVFCLSILQICDVNSNGLWWQVAAGGSLMANSEWVAGKFCAALRWTNRERIANAWKIVQPINWLWFRTPCAVPIVMHDA